MTGADGEGVRLHRRRDAGAAPGELLRDDAAVERPEAHAAVLGRDVGVHQPELPRLLRDLARELARLVVVRRLRRHLLARELPGQLLKRLLFLGQGEIDHRALLVPARKGPLLRCSRGFYRHAKEFGVLGSPGRQLAPVEHQAGDGDHPERLRRDGRQDPRQAPPGLGVLHAREREVRRERTFLPGKPLRDEGLLDGRRRRPSAPPPPRRTQPRGPSPAPEEERRRAPRGRGGTLRRVSLPGPGPRGGRGRSGRQGRRLRRLDAARPRSPRGT